jgi:hypothetical protein
VTSLCLIKPLFLSILADSATLVELASLRMVVVLLLIKTGQISSANGVHHALGTMEDKIAGKMSDCAVNQRCKMFLLENAGSAQVAEVISHRMLANSREIKVGPIGPKPIRSLARAPQIAEARLRVDIRCVAKMLPPKLITLTKILLATFANNTVGGHGLKNTVV